MSWSEELPVSHESILIIHTKHKMLRSVCLVSWRESFEVGFMVNVQGEKFPELHLGLLQRWSVCPREQASCRSRCHVHVVSSDCQPSLDVLKVKRQFASRLFWLSSVC